MGDSVAISAQNVSKKYRLFNSPQERLWETLHPFNKKYHREFWALREIDFQIPKGATVGIVGRNGSGKSTLLKIICSVLKPTTGSIQVNGEVSALLSLDAGLNPKFTGRDNVFFKGALMGISPGELKHRMKDIEAFADIGEFFDQPLQIYSSGMMLRLAFAIAINVDPDILVMDEVIAVGDAKFQQKCFQKFREYQESGKTILITTHDTNTITRHCDHAIFIDNGAKLQYGHPKDVVESYLNFILTGSLTTTTPSPKDDPLPMDRKAYAPGLETSSSELKQFLMEVPDGDHCIQRKYYNKDEYRFGDQRASIIDFFIISEAKVEPASICSGSSIDIYIKVKFHQPVENPMFGFAIKTVDGTKICGSNTRFRNIPIEPATEREIIVYCFTLKMNLHPGDYFIDLGIAEKHSAKDHILDVRNGLIHLPINFKNQFDGIVDLELNSREILRLPSNSKETI